MTKLLALAAVSTVAMIGAAQAQEQIQIAGSSTVLPFASTVAEEFGNTFAAYPTPIVESGGSSGGLRQFCEGVGNNTIDIADASRPIRSSEIEACAAAGVPTQDFVSNNAVPCGSTIIKNRFNRCPEPTPISPLHQEN